MDCNSHGPAFIWCCEDGLAFIWCCEDGLRSILHMEVFSPGHLTISLKFSNNQFNSRSILHIIHISPQIQDIYRGQCMSRQAEIPQIQDHL